MPATITAATITKARADARPGSPRYEVVDARARGLVLRVSPTGAQWQLRYAIAGKDKRLALGSVDQWTIAEARTLVGRAQDMLRDRMGIPDEAWLDRMRLREGKAAAVMLVAEPVVAPRIAFKMAFSDGRRLFLDEIKRTRSAGTWHDYRQKLGLPEFDVLEKDPLPTIARQRLAGIIGSIHRSGREATAEGAARVLSSMWSWLASDDQIEKTGVSAGVMLGLKAPERTRKASKRMVADPTLEDLGRIIAIARSQAVDPLIGCAIELVVWSVQRRRAVAAAKLEDFRGLDDDERGLWYVYADDRKRSDGEAHVVPLPEPAWAAVQRAIQIGEADHRRRLEKDPATPAPEYLFPQYRPRQRGGAVSHMHESTITHMMGFMPGVASSPHHVRHIFGTFGERMLGFSRASTKMILDHAEGGLRSDVTGRHYALHSGEHEKWPIAERWCEAVEADATAAMIGLEPVDQLKAAIAAARYGDEGVRQAAE